MVCWKQPQTVKVWNNIAVTITEYFFHFHIGMQYSTSKIRKHVKTTKLITWLIHHFTHVSHVYFIVSNYTTCKACEEHVKPCHPFHILFRKWFHIFLCLFYIHCTLCVHIWQTFHMQVQIVEQLSTQNFILKSCTDVQWTCWSMGSCLVADQAWELIQFKWISAPPRMGCWSIQGLPPA